MADIVNLRQVRKQKERDAARARGIAAAAKSSRTKALKVLEKARADKAGHDHDQHRRDGQHSE